MKTSPRPFLSRLVALVCVLLPLAALRAAPLVDDPFTRSVTGGWGSTPQGLTYTISGGTTTDFSVTSTKSAIKLTTNANRLARLTLSPALGNLEGTVRIAFNALPTANYAYAGPAAHVQGGGDYYYFRLRHDVSGSVSLVTQKIVSGSQTTLGTEVVVGTGYTAGAWYRVRFSTVVSGSTTYLRAKAWPDAADEPALWQVETSDTTVALQPAGGVGIRAGAHSSYAPLNVFYYVDDLKVWDTAFVPNLTSAIRAAHADDIIYFTGTHTAPGSGPSTDTRTLADGTAAQPIIVRGFGGAVLQGYTLSQGYGLYIQNDYWRFDNFAVTRAPATIYAIGADHGVLSRMETYNSGRAGFKFRRYSQYWEVVECAASETGVATHEYGEGFYIGDDSDNWELDGSGNKIPDTTGYFVFRDCYTTDTWSDGYDLKEGVHHVKFINCVADFSGPIEPLHDNATSGSGFSLRGGDYVQLINCSVHDLNNSEAAFKHYGTVIDGVSYGSNIAYKAVSATNITDQAGTTGAAMFLLSGITSSALTIYSDYTQTNTTTFKLGSGTYTSGMPANFVELTW